MEKGGKRTGAGRPKGSRNKTTVDVKAIAQSYGADAVKTLAEMMKDKKAPPAARVAAAKELLDRGYGRAKQEMEHTGGVTLNVITGVSNEPDTDR